MAVILWDMLTILHSHGYLQWISHDASVDRNCIVPLFPPVTALTRIKLVLALSYLLEMYRKITSDFIAVYSCFAYFLLVGKWNIASESGMCESKNTG